MKRHLKCTVCSIKFTYPRNKHTLWCDKCYNESVLQFDSKVVRNTIDGKIQRDGVNEI